MVGIIVEIVLNILVGIIVWKAVLFLVGIVVGVVGVSDSNGAFYFSRVNVLSFWLEFSLTDSFWLLEILELVRGIVVLIASGIAI